MTDLGYNPSDDEDEDATAPQLRALVAPAADPNGLSPFLQQFQGAFTAPVAAAPQQILPFQAGLALLSAAYSPPPGSLDPNAAAGPVPGVLSPEPPIRGLLGSGPEETSPLVGGVLGAQTAAPDWGASAAPVIYSAAPGLRPATWTGSAAPTGWDIQPPPAARTVSDAGPAIAPDDAGSPTIGQLARAEPRIANPPISSSGDGDSADASGPANQGSAAENAMAAQDSNDGDNTASAAVRSSPGSNVTEAGAASPLGSLSMVYETGYRPGQEAQAAAKVSSGAGDPQGGVSYGAYQLSSGAGQVQAFLRSPQGAPWARRFDGRDPTVSGGAFGQTWRSIAQADPQAFFNAQHDYIQSTHYDPVVSHVLADTGVNIDSQSDAVRNAVWSMAVQHAAAPRLVEEAVDNLQGTVDPASADYQRALINSLYDVRDQYVARIGMPNLQSRYAEERRDALAALGR